MRRTFHYQRCPHIARSAASTNNLSSANSGPAALSEQKCAYGLSIVASQLYLCYQAHV